MNLLSIGHSQSGGGLQTVFRINNEIKDEEINITTAFKSDEENEADIELKRVRDGKNIFIKIFNYFFISKNYHSIKRILKEGNIDLIHLHSASGLSLSLLLALRKYKGDTKLVYTSHGYGLVCPNYSCYNYSKNKLCTKCIYKKNEMRIVWNKCDRRGYVFSFIRFIDLKLRNIITKNNKIFDTVITPSHYLKKLLDDSKYNFNEVKVVSNPIETVNYSNNRKEDVISYVGRFSEEKNVDLLIQSFSDLVKIKGYENLKLQIIGEGREKNNYKKKIKELNLSNKVYISEKFLNKDELTKMIQPSKVMVLPTGSPETFGLVVLEGIKMKMIPVAYNIGGQAENIERVGIGELYTEMNSKYIKNAIMNALDTYAKSKEQLEKANIVIDDLFSVKEYNNKIKKIYFESLKVN
ncbi:glycosyltransferase family 1 protein [Staphylococcus equorum]|uniref:glycosyltransferase family 1 protein n=1 Tax=Staphylococcus equorum TaxID=246432 RepID=UPI0008FD1F62|nr:hypothetical protein BFN02_05070 [Staphylococcus equorum]